MKEIQEKKILDFLQTKEYASVEELAILTHASHSTIRRALNTLQAKNLITRTHGGAKIHMESNVSPSFTFRIHQNSFEKKKMALSAIKLIKDGDIVFLDGSTSAYYIAEYLNEFKDIKVVTNGIDTLSLLSKNRITAYSTGGLISSVNPSVLVGRYAENTIENFYADIAFISAQSIDEKGEIFDCFEEEIFLRRAMLKNARKKVFLCDSTKVNKTSPYHLCSIKDMDCIVSNTSLSNIQHADTIEQIITDK